MGSKKSSVAKAKSKQKKDDQKKLIEMEKAMKGICDIAQKVPDQLENFLPFKSYKKEGLDISLSYHHSENMTKEQRTFIFDLLKSNMQDIFNETETWKWKDREKKEEVYDDDARYIMLTDNTTKEYAGFVHLRFLVEDELDQECLYVWEIQLVPSFRKKGLGSFLMKLLELMAIRNKMKYTVLTVIKGNTAATKFWGKLKYIPAPHSPDGIEAHDYEYEILCKCLDPTLLMEIKHHNEKEGKD